MGGAPTRLTTPGDGKIILCSVIEQDYSPFVRKVARILQFYNIPFEFKRVPIEQLPRGKMPVLHIDGEIISDSQNIINVLVQKGKIPASDIPDEQFAVAEMFRLAIENFLYWGVTQERWTDRFEQTRPKYFGNVFPAVLNYIIPTWIVKPGMEKQLYQVGISRYPKNEVWNMFEDFMKHSSAMLGKKKFFFGKESPALHDLIVFAFFGAILDDADLNPKMASNLEKHSNLVRFVRDMESFFSKDK
jgi:glutathione S-transferase